MARNGSGTYTKVNTFVAGNSITAAGHNANWDDIATEVTNSVAADGQTTMTGPLKAASGTVSAPGVTFASDTDCGLYRIGANNIGVAANGAKVLDVATTGLTVTGEMNATTVKQAGFAILPVGLGPLPWSGTAAPSGWVLANGATLNRADYPDLWTFAAAEIALSNSLYTNGNGTTTFTVPDMKGRIPAGKEAAATRLTATHFGGDSTALGATGGSESHTLTTAQLASHTHTGTTGDQSANHTHGFNAVLTDIPAALNYGGGVNAGTNADTAGTTGIESAVHQHNFTTAATGSGNAHNNTQPTIITNYIIFAGV
jgi:microcystin-dependent protein